MRIKFLATGIAPQNYSFDGEKITFNGETFDLSQFEEGDIFEGIEGEIQGIRSVERIKGELYVTLCQKAPKGHWTGINEYIDSNNYNPKTLYIRPKTPEETQEVAGWEI